MELPPKGLILIIHAIKYQIKWYESQIERKDITEDEHSDLTMDMMYLESILKGLREELRKKSFGNPFIDKGIETGIY
jgi:hypothetical protein